MSVHFADLTYTDEELEQDAIHYLETMDYNPSYAVKVKGFLAHDISDFKRYYDDAEYVFFNVFYDEYKNGYSTVDDRIIPNTDFVKLTGYLADNLQLFDINENEIDNYVMSLDSEFRKNSLCTHMEPYFIGRDAVIATVINGYTKNPLCSIYAIVREWCMALHIKKMYPQEFRRLGYQYQEIQYNYKGEDRLNRLVDFRDKYKRIFHSISVLRSIHSSVFAYAYLFLKAIQTNEILLAEDFIMENSSSQIYLLLHGESIKNFDFPVTKYVLDDFKSGKYKDFILEDKRINWEALYQYTFDAIKQSNFDGVHVFGFDSAEAKTIRAYWNKSQSMQSMLKILRKMAMENDNPVFRRLIEGCEYRLGRKDKEKSKMEHFIEETRKMMLANSADMLHPRNIAQELVAAFPSVFLVYFQWHHSFRTIYPKVPKKQNDELLQQQTNLKDLLIKQWKNNEETVHLQNVMQGTSLKNTLSQQEEQRQNFLKNNDVKTAKSNNAEYESKLRSIMMNKEKTLAQMSIENKKEQANVAVLDKKLLNQNTY